MLLPQEIIRHKRDGLKLSQSEIEFMISGFVKGSVPDYQMSALAMAIFLNGCDDQETAFLLHAMIASGKKYDWKASAPGRIFVDKHSTGGVGDKTSLVILPLLICDGLSVPMVAGRGLGHTGGTLDKLESLPGIKTQVDAKTFESWVLKEHGAFGGQTEDFVPADKRLYSLRDVTATVESWPLITASIMSKKLAEGLDALVLDVKFGSGAVMQNYDDAKNLAHKLVNAGNAAGCRTIAALTNMEEPLGRSAGNALEVIECLDVLQGAGPTDTRELSLRLAAATAALGRNETSEMQREKAYQRMKDHLQSGRAYEVFLKIAVQQGASLADLERHNSKWYSDGVVTSPIYPVSSGFITSIDTRALGLALIEMGGGRVRKEDSIHYQVGLTEIKKRGEYVSKDEPLCLAHFASGRKSIEIMKKIQASYTTGDVAPPDIPLIKEWI